MTSDTTTEASANTLPSSAEDLPDYAPLPQTAHGPALHEQGYYVGRVERNLYWVTDGTYQSAFLTTSDGVVLLDAPPTIGHNIQRAVDEIASANGVSTKVTHLIYTHHHADHAGASSLFDGKVARIGHEETRKLQPIDRTGVNSWEDVDFIAAVHATGRRKLIFSALWTEVCMAFAALDALGGLRASSRRRRDRRHIHGGAPRLRRARSPGRGHPDRLGLARVRAVGRQGDWNRLERECRRSSRSS